MNDRNGRVGWGRGLVGAIGVLLCAGCVEGPTGLQIDQAQVPEIKEGSCIVPATKTEVHLGSGVLDVGLDRPYGYELYPLLSNKMPKLSSGGAEPNRIDVTAFEVNLEPPPSLEVPWTDGCPSRFDTPHSASLSPGQDAGAIAQIIRPCHAEIFRGLFMAGRISSKVTDEIIVRAVVRARGKHGGSTIRSAEFEFPVRVCYGCLQTGYTIPELTDYEFPKVPPCAKMPVHPYMGNPCNPGQDAPILCCARDDAGKVLECPAQPRVRAMGM